MQDDFINQVYNKSSQRMDKLPDESIDCTLTSPPYWGLRDYGEDVKEIWGGDPTCCHIWDFEQVRHDNLRFRGKNSDVRNEQKLGIHSGSSTKSGFCVNCNAWRGQLGLEPTFQLYLDHMVTVCAEVKRVLKGTGSFWLNMGDTYGGSWQDFGSRKGGQRPKSTKSFERKDNPQFYPPTARIMQKCLLGIPWRLALRLIDEQGWILRNAIIWNKPNHMPSSVKDRCSNGYEFLFHLVKAKEKYKWPKNIKLIPKEDKIWLAAIVDGEGTIGIMKSKRENWVDSFAPYIRVCNSTKAIVDKCVEITGLGVVRIHKDKVAKERGYRQIYVWQPSNRSAAYIIGQIYDCLIAKKEQAKVAIALEEQLPPRGIKGKHTSEVEYEKREELWILSKQLNQHNIKNSGLPDINAKWKGPIYGNCEKYIYDLDAIREPYTKPLNRWGGNKIFIPQKTKWKSDDEKAKWAMSVRERKSRPNSSGKNPGDIWTIPTQSRPEAHFATFPDKLCTKPILATCPQEICKKCGKARVRISKVKSNYTKRESAYQPNNEPTKVDSTGWKPPNSKTIGFTDCGCNAGFEPGIVLDPFAGRGTALIMAKKLGRHYVGYELKKEYCKKLIEPTLTDIDPLFRNNKEAEL